MRKKIQILSLVLPFIILGKQAIAQISGTPLEEITIKENRLRNSLKAQNLNIRVITKEQIAALPVRSITDLLSYVAGVDLRQRGPGGVQADVSIDGGTFDQSLVLINGIRMTDAQTGHNMMNIPITLDVVDHIEILRGSAARIYGINALTGAINFVTKTPINNQLQVTGYTGSNFERSESSDNKYNNWGGRITLSKVTDKTSHLVSVSHDKGNGYRYNTAFENSKAFYQGIIHTKGSDQLEIMGGYAYNDYGANGFYAAPGDKNSTEKVKKALGTIGYQASINSNWVMRPRISYLFSEDDYRYIVGNPPVGRNLHKTHIFNAEWNNSIHTSKGDIGFGVEARNEHIISTNLGNHDRYNYGISGEYRFADLGRFSLTAGGYLNYNTTYGWQFFPGVDAGFKITEPLKWFANVGTGQRLPTYTDLYYKGPSNIGNADLTPEKSRYAETGFKFQKNHLNITASYFYRRINDFIDWTKASVSDPWQPNNFQRINTQGLTFALDYRLTTTRSYFSNTILGVSYTHLMPKITKPSSTGSQISLYAISNLRDQLVITASSDIVTGLNVSIAGRYLKRISYKDYFILDGKISYSFIKKLRFYIDATNISNITYIEAAAAPLPGKWYTMGVNFSL